MAEHVVLKLLIYLFNFILLLCGLALVVGGSMVQIHYKDYLDGLEAKVFIAPILLIIAGVVMVLIAAFGCFGTCKRLSWTLIVFAILLAAVFLVEIAASIVAYMERGTVREHIERRMNWTMTAIAHKNSSSELDRELWNRLQTDFQCCGVKSFKDWRTLANSVVPPSCCRLAQTKDCAAEAEIRAKCEKVGDVNDCPVYTKGCLIATEEYAKNNIGMVGGIGFGVAAFQVLGVVLAACLAKKIRNDGEL